MKEYILKPIMTHTTVNLALTADKPAVARTRPPRQPLPTAVLEPAKPRLALGLDGQLGFIIVVGPQNQPPLPSPPPASPLAPRRPRARQAAPRSRPGRASGIHHGRGPEGSRPVAVAPQVHPRTTRRLRAPVRRRGSAGLLRPGKLRLRLRAAPRTGRRRRAEFSHHPHGVERQAQD